MSSAVEKYREAQRELAYRRRVYAKLLAENRLQPEIAEQRIAIMQEIVEDYRRLAEIDEPNLFTERSH